MLVNIRQGIVYAQSAPPFLNLNSGNVDLDASVSPTLITFADGNSDYLYTESESVTSAWAGPFSVGTDYYLYWDIDKTTGARTFGYTTIEPTFGLTRPSSPVNDQHFFDTSSNKMLVWNGRTWIETLRIFAGEIENGTTLIVEGEGSQVSITEDVLAGHILFDQNNIGIKHGDFFLTEETVIHTSQNKLNYYKLESEIYRAQAVSHIPKFHAVSWQGLEKIGLASNVSPNLGAAIGLAVEDINSGEIKQFVTDGFVTNDEWNFSEPSGTLLFVGKNGEVTTTVPQQVSLQRIGQVINASTIYLKIEELFLIDTIPLTPTPTPSVTVSFTPTPTPTMEISLTPTLTPTITPTIASTGTPTPTITKTLTPTPTLTPTLTVTGTVTPTPTPSAEAVVVGTDAYASGGNGGSSTIIEAFPFSSPFVSSVSVGDLSEDMTAAAGQSTSDDGYVSGGTPVGTTINRFPFSSPFTTASDIGNLSVILTRTSGQFSFDDGYTSGGFVSTSNIEVFPFSTPFTTSTTAGNLAAGRYGASAQSSSDDGYSSGGRQSSSLNYTRIDIFPFFTPFANSTLVGDLSADVRDATGQHSADEGFSSGGRESPTATTTSNIDRFPFTSPFTAATSVGDLSLSRWGRDAGQSSSDDGYTSGGYDIAGSAIVDRIDSFPFYSPFATASDVGNLSVARQNISGQFMTSGGV